MSVIKHNHETPISPIIEVNTMESEERERRSDLEKVILDDVEYRGLVCGPEGEDADDAEEPLERKMASDVKTPTRSEVLEHEKTHLPFRSWCRCCVKGRGVASPHASIKEDPTAPQVVMDYCFPRAKVTILGIKHVLSGATASMLVPKKGGSIVWIAKHIMNLIDHEWGPGYR